TVVGLPPAVMPADCLKSSADTAFSTAVPPEPVVAVLPADIIGASVSAMPQRGKGDAVYYQSTIGLPPTHMPPPAPSHQTPRAGEAPVSLAHMDAYVEDTSAVERALEEQRERERQAEQRMEEAKREAEMAAETVRQNEVRLEQERERVRLAQEKAELDKERALIEKREAKAAKEKERERERQEAKEAKAQREREKKAAKLARSPKASYYKYTIY
ncbi:hypothetical protein KIPB_009122, partial [Kipferlia bialata]